MDDFHKEVSLVLDSSTCRYLVQEWMMLNNGDAALLLIQPDWWPSGLFYTDPDWFNGVGMFT
jgi:hypothetical protein